MKGSSLIIDRIQGEISEIPFVQLRLAVRYVWQLLWAFQEKKKEKEKERKMLVKQLILSTSATQKSFDTRPSNNVHSGASLRNGPS